MTERNGGPRHPLVIPLTDLDPSPHSHEFIGAEHGDVPFSIILVHSEPGVGPKVHRHPYAEVFIVESGEATFRLGHETMVVGEGHVVVGPPDVPHGFTNSGSGELRLVAIHGASRFATEWLEGTDRTWMSIGGPAGGPARSMQAIADAARSVDGIDAAVVFILDSGTGMLAVRGAAGIDGPALDGLAAAARNPEHRIPQALAANDPEWDVLPMNPGGPKLRSHLPIRADGVPTGVLALAHDEPLEPRADARVELEAVADEAAGAAEAAAPVRAR